MTKVMLNLYVGSEDDYFSLPSDLDHWFVVQAARYPFYWDENDGDNGGIIKAGNRLILDMIDAREAEYFQFQHFETALEVIHRRLQKPTSVLIHCNRGLSRSPSIAMLYLAHFAKKIPSKTYFDAARLMYCIYPRYLPGEGIQRYLIENWDRFRKLSTGVV